MQSTQTHQTRGRLPRYVPLSDTDRKAKADLERTLTMGRGEDVLRENVKKANVKICEHLIRLVRRDSAIARKVAVCLLGHYGVRSDTVANKIALCIAETGVECQENALEAKYMAGLCDSSEKAQLADAVTEHIATLEALRDCVAADLYNITPRASL